jgi:hypothetical protein
VNLATLLDEWATKYDVHTVLERALGRAAEPACAALAAGGKTTVVVVDDEESASRVRAAYGAKADVRIAGRADDDLPKSDLVVIHGGAPAGDWRASLHALGKHAAKLVVVAAENEGAWQAEMRSRLSRVAGGDGDSGWGRTEVLAPLLWEIGRVKEHAFLDVPMLGQRAPRLASRVAPLHAFVVDVTPRSPQARRRLRLETA